jgi:protein-tyrosine phosphatase
MSDRAMNRDLAWPDCYNARDLGGLPAAGGRTTAWRSVIRSDILSRLTADGRQALLEYGVRTIIDLRAAHEAAAEPSLDPVWAGGRLTCLNRPLEHYYPHVGRLIVAARSRAEVYAIILDHYPDAVAGALRAVAGAEPGGVVIHCHGGRDRTGMASALLLRLAGVPAEVVIADYAASQERLRPLFEQIEAEKGPPPADAGFWQRPTATAEMMAQMLAHLDGRYGGVEGYLKAAGLTDSDVVRLRMRLVTD